MLSSPITVTINAVDRVLPRINNDNYSSVYRLKWTDNELTVTVRHSYEGKEGAAQMERHNVDMVHKIVDALGVTKTYQTYTVFRFPRSSAVTVPVQDVTGLNAWVTANAAAIAAWES